MPEIKGGDYYLSNTAPNSVEGLKLQIKNTESEREQKLLRDLYPEKQEKLMSPRERRKFEKLLKNDPEIDEDPELQEILERELRQKQFEEDLRQQERQKKRKKENPCEGLS